MRPGEYAGRIWTSRRQPVYEAIEAAGGFSEAAVPDYLNLAQVLEDGMKIQVPDRDQAEEWKARGLTQSGISMGGGTAGVQTSGRTGSGERAVQRPG